MTHSADIMPNIEPHSYKLYYAYGPVVRLAPNGYSLNSSESAKVILGHRNGLDKSKYYHPFGLASVFNVFTETRLSVHATIRRPLAQLYSQTALLSYEPFVDTCNSLLLKRLEEYAENGETMDLRDMMQFYAFDVIGEITVGTRFGFMEVGDTTGIITAIEKGTTYACFMGLLPEWHWWVSKLSEILKRQPGFKKVVNFVCHHVDNRISGRTKSPGDHSDFLDKMLRVEKEGKATRFHIEEATIQNINAGSDTSAIALTTAIAHLCVYPNTLAALRNELDAAAAAAAAGSLSDPVTFQEAQKLPYLQAVIMEALRIHPAVGAPLTRVAGPEGLQIDGYYFPPGTEVGVNAWAVHNNTSIFGPDAHVFRPERWLTENKEERAVLDRNLLSFGNGARTCIGKNISLMEMSKVIAHIVQKYDFDLQPNDQGQKFSWKTRWFAKPIVHAVVKRRSRG
ncbi:hypothetical protein ACJQWK_08105 [Exserohilum turcicum]